MKICQYVDEDGSVGRECT